MSLLARVVSGRRSKYLVLGAWLLALVAAGPLAAEFESKQRNEPSSFLPRSAESVAVLEAAREFPSGQATAAIVVFSRPGGLTPADRKAIDDVQAQLNAAATEGLKGVGPPRYSADRTAAILVAPIVAKGADEVLLDAVDSIGQTASDGVPPGLDVKVTGDRKSVV